MNHIIKYYNLYLLKISYELQRIISSSYLTLARNIPLVWPRCFGRCWCGVGIVFASLVFGLARNPAEEAVCSNMHVGIRPYEAVGLLGLMMAFLLLFS